MMEATRLKSGRILTASAPKLAFPETDPVLDLTFFIHWRAKQVDVIGHDQIITNEPRAGFVPRGNNRVMNICVRERLHPVSGANGEEHDCGLATKNENTFCWMPASNMVAHIWLFPFTTLFRSNLLALGQDLCFSSPATPGI